jgi:hypothetical protein
MRSTAMIRIMTELVQPVRNATEQRVHLMVASVVEAHQTDSVQLVENLPSERFATHRFDGLLKPTLSAPNVCVHRNHAPQQPTRWRGDCGERAHCRVVRYWHLYIGLFDLFQPLPCLQLS